MLNIFTWQRTTVVIVIAWLLALLTTIIYIGYLIMINSLGKLEDLRLLLYCILIGGVGGGLYCLRAVYLQYSVKNEWTRRWLLWYLVRPFTSLICGGVSYVFLKAGLLILEAQKENDATNLGFYALAFIAGLNVDKFISKIEDLANATWGIERSRATKDSNSNR